MPDEPAPPCNCKWTPKDIIAVIGALAAMVSVIIASLNHQGIQQFNERPKALTQEQTAEVVKQHTPTPEKIAEKVNEKWE